MTATNQIETRGRKPITPGENVVVTSFSCPSTVREQANRFAKSVKLSRSQLVCVALTEYLERHGASEVAA